MRKMNRGVRRPRHVDVNDKRSPMVRCLQDASRGARLNDAGMPQVWPNYPEQWRTIFKAQRLGYVDADQFLTRKGKDFIDAVGA
jgi:hypothetical protein